MQLTTLISIIPTIQDSDCIVTFTDGDRYEIRHLDFRGYFEGEFEIAVDFRDCLDASATMKQAWEDGYLKTQRVSWISTKPHTPVVKTYLIKDIVSIFDRAENYEIFTADQASRPHL